MDPDLQQFKNIFLIGIGGIGMSAIARYFNHAGKSVAGYDLHKTDLTQQLEKELITVFYSDDVNLIPKNFLNKSTIVVKTPAVPDDLQTVKIWEQYQVPVLRRSQMLSAIAGEHKVYAVAGTHGKTTITTLLSHLLNQRDNGINSFMGGISANYRTNLLLSKDTNEMVVEADEYDKAFLLLRPYSAIVTSIDPDHLDIYSTHKNLISTFNKFINQIDREGILIYKKDLPLVLPKNLKAYSYCIEGNNADIYPKNIVLNDGFYTFDLIYNNQLFEKLRLGVSGLFNLENAVAASAMAIFAGLEYDELKDGLASFKGVERRFDVRYNEQEVYIDDYAHHPLEITACLKSIRQIFPEKHITTIFQPHLYSRTRDLFYDFVKALSKADTAIITDIYAAREIDLGDVSAQQMADSIPNGIYIPRDEILEYVEQNTMEILVTMGAGDIGDFAKSITQIIKDRD